MRIESQCIRKEEGTTNPIQKPTQLKLPIPDFLDPEKQLPDAETFQRYMLAFIFGSVEQGEEQVIVGFRNIHELEQDILSVETEQIIELRTTLEIRLRVVFIRSIKNMFPRDTNVKEFINKHWDTWFNYLFNIFLLAFRGQFNSFFKKTDKLEEQYQCDIDKIFKFLATLIYCKMYWLRTLHTEKKRGRYEEHKERAKRAILRAIQLNWHFNIFAEPTKFYREGRGIDVSHMVHGDPEGESYLYHLDNSILLSEEAHFLYHVYFTDFPWFIGLTYRENINAINGVRGRIDYGKTKVQNRQTKNPTSSLSPKVQVELLSSLDMYFDSAPSFLMILFEDISKDLELTSKIFRNIYNVQPRWKEVIRRLISIQDAAERKKEIQRILLGENSSEVGDLNAFYSITEFIISLIRASKDCWDKNKYDELIQDIVNYISTKVSKDFSSIKENSAGKQLLSVVERFLHEESSTDKSTRRSKQEGLDPTDDVVNVFVMTLQIITIALYYSTD